MNKQEFLQKIPKLIAKYQPAPGTIDRIGDVELLIVVGPSGVGKSSLIEKLGIPLVPSDTTRQPRIGEVDGQDMFFRKDYQQMLNELSNNDFVQVAIGSAGDFYATRASSYPSSGLSAMPVISDVVPIFRNLEFKSTVTIFIVPPSFEEWMKRMGAHNLQKEQLQRRLNEAKRSFQFALDDQETHYILNDNLADAALQVEELLAGKVDQEREQKAKNLVLKLSKQLLGL